MIPNKIIFVLFCFLCLTSRFSPLLPHQLKHKLSLAIRQNKGDSAAQPTYELDLSS